MKKNLETAENFLGIDLGQKHCGLALGTKNHLSTAFKTITFQDPDELIDKLKNICNDYQINRIIIGKPTPEIEPIQNLRKNIIDKIELPTEIADETLSSVDARNLMIKHSIPQRKKKRREHAFAAKAILDLWQKEQNMI